MYNLGHLHTIKRVDLYLPDTPFFVHLHIHLDQPARKIVSIWEQESLLVNDWMTEEFFAVREIPSRSTWNADSAAIAGYSLKWDHPLESIDDLYLKVRGFLACGYEIAKVRRV